jgi:DNA-binding CsgD family transcriptional regulator
LIPGVLAVLPALLPKTFETALKCWQAAQVASAETQRLLVQQLVRLADENTNLYLIDMRPTAVDQFGFKVVLENIDLRIDNPPEDTLGSHPDKAYSTRDVLPHYKHVAEAGEVRFDALKSRLIDVYAQYDRIIFPIFAPGDRQRPSRSIALSRPKLVVEPGQGDVKELSPHELTIFNMVASGLTTKEIAREIASSPRTIESHVNSIKRKMGAKNITHAVALYLLRLTFD